MKPPRLHTILTLLATLVLIGSVLAILPSCTSAEKAQAQVLVKQIGTQIAKDAGLAAANTAVTLAQRQLASANEKLATYAAAVAANPSASLADQAKLSALQIAAKEAATLLDAATKQLAKLNAVDALPATPDAATLPPVTVTPAS